MLVAASSLAQLLSPSPAPLPPPPATGNQHRTIPADAVATPRAGEGAFAQVVLARHKTTRQFVALKVIFLRNPEADDEALAGMLACASCSTSSVPLPAAVTSPRCSSRVVHCPVSTVEPEQQAIML